MTHRAQFAAAAAAHRAGAAASRERYRNLSRDRLARIIRKKLTTATIGLLARFEDHFGRDLWGHGKPTATCTPEEAAWREQWEACRTACLDHAHAQLRALEKELSEYDVTWLRHQTDLVVAAPPTPEDR